MLSLRVFWLPMFLALPLQASVRRARALPIPNSHIREVLQFILQSSGTGERRPNRYQIEYLSHAMETYEDIEFQDAEFLYRIGCEKGKYYQTSRGTSFASLTI